MRLLTCEKLYGSLAAVTLVTGAPAIASEFSDAVHACAQEPDDARRLTCYDRAAGHKGSSGTLATPAKPAASSALVTSATAAPAKPAVVAPAAADVTATVTHVARRADGRYVVTLDNGEVWREVETKERFSVDEGDTVTLRTQLLGTHFMHTSAGNDVRVVRAP